MIKNYHHILKRLALLNGQKLTLKKIDTTLSSNSTRNIRDTEEFLNAAKILDIDLIEKNQINNLNESLPVLVENKTGELFLIIRISGDKTLVFDPNLNTSKSLTLPTKEMFASIKNTYYTLSENTPIHIDKTISYKWLFLSLINHKSMFIEIILATIFIQVFALSAPLFMQVVIDKVMVNRGVSTLEVLALGLGIVTVFEIIMGGIRYIMFSYIGNNTDKAFQQYLTKYLFSVPLEYFRARKMGDIVARVKETDTIRNVLTGNTLTTIIDFTFSGLFIVVMYYFSPALTSIVLLSIPLYMLVGIFVTHPMQEQLRQKSSQAAEVQTKTIEALDHIEAIKSQAAEKYILNRLDIDNQKLRGIFKKAGHYTNLSQQSTQFIQKCTMVITLYMGSVLVLENTLTVGAMVAFNMLSSRATAPLLKIAQVWQEIQQMRISSERLNDILQCPKEQDTNSGYHENLKGNVKFKNITFKYESQNQNLFENLSFQIEKESFTAIVGPSGAGKSTIIRLLQKLYHPQKGQIIIGDCNIHNTNVTYLRENIAVILQDNSTFSGTVEENITFYNQDISHERVVESAKLANAHDFIEALGEGYDTFIGEKGLSLSGGQRQRIAIARAIAKNTPFIIFDEATSALDADSENKLIKNIPTITKDRTCIMIAHRLSTIHRADKILFLQDGKIHEQGTHQELIKKNTHYAAYWQKQMVKV